MHVDVTDVSDQLARPKLKLFEVLHLQILLLRPDLYHHVMPLLRILDHLPCDIHIHSVIFISLVCSFSRLTTPFS